MPEIILPKSHLSWSQMQIWRSSPDRYRREYFEGGKKLDTKYLKFGKSIASAIENGTYKDIVPDLMVLPEVEYEIKTTIAGVPVLCYLDSYCPKFHVFDEYKTGKIPWDQAKVQKHDQLLFYATALREIKGEMPGWCDLMWLETKEDERPETGFMDSERKVSLTGKIQSFRRVFDERELNRMELEILKTAQEISEAYKEFLSEL